MNKLNMFQNPKFWKQCQQIVRVDNEIPIRLNSKRICFCSFRFPVSSRMLSAALKVGIYSSRVLPAVVSQRKEVELK